MKRSPEFKQEKGFISHTQGHKRHGVIGHTHLCVQMLIFFLPIESADLKKDVTCLTCRDVRILLMM